MKKDYCHISIVLDRSGSMEAVAGDTIGGFNSFMKRQKEVPGQATVTLVQFDHEYEELFTGKDVKAVEDLTDKTFVPRGVTALLDAIGRTIVTTGAWLKDKPEHERPEKVVFVIITDGYENASTEFAASRVFDMIKHQRDIYKWEFVFLGADQDAIASAAKLGIAASNAMTYKKSAVGVAAAFSSTADNIASYRSGKTQNMAYTGKDRDEQDHA